MGRFLKTWLMPMLLAVLAGCVTKQVEPEHAPRLVVSQGGDGLVTLNFKSEIGYKYKILVMDAQAREKGWQELEGVGAIRGTGKTITLQDRCNPRKPLPWYNITYSRVKD